jgi:hypothetical protein
MGWNGGFMRVTLLLRHLAWRFDLGSADVWEPDWLYL